MIAGVSMCYVLREFSNFLIVLTCSILEIFVEEILEISMIKTF
jgi:hypothetical protein